MKASGPRALRSFCRVLRLFNQETDHAARKHMLQDRLPRPTNKKNALIPKPCTGSPLRRLQVKLSVCKALNLPRSDGTDPAHATDALDKNIRLGLKKYQSKSNDRLRRGRIQCLDYQIAHHVRLESYFKWYLPQSLLTKFALTHLIKSRDVDVAHTKHTSTSCELPKAKIITKTNSGVSRRRHNNENARCCKTVVVSNHARYHSCSPPGYA